MQERQDTDGGKFVRAITPLSSAIQAVALTISIAGLFLIPRLFADTRHQIWPYLTVGAISIALLRASRRAMARKKEVDENVLSAAERQSKHTLKFLLILAGVAFLILASIVISADVLNSSFSDLSWSTKISIALLIVVYCGALVLGRIYMRRFVNRENAT